jgi:ribosome-associated protein
MEIRRPRRRGGKGDTIGQPPPTRRALTIALHAEYITLGQLLKVAGVIGSGGEAKPYLADHVVQVNGEPEQRRGRKLRSGDIVVPPGRAPIHLAAGGADVDEDAADGATGGDGA